MQVTLHINLGNAQNDVEERSSLGKIWAQEYNKIYFFKVLELVQWNYAALNWEGNVIETEFERFQPGIIKQKHNWRCIFEKQRWVYRYWQLARRKSQLDLRTLAARHPGHVVPQKRMKNNLFVDLINKYSYSICLKRFLFFSIGWAELKIKISSFRSINNNVIK